MIKSAHIFTRILVAVLCLLALPLAAQACVTSSDNAATLDGLIAKLRSAPSETKGRALNAEIWKIWSTAPDAKAQDLLDRGVARMREADYERAVDILTDLVEYCPDYAEGWNQRAFAEFLRQNYPASLEDITETLQREPRHYGALTGRALVFISMGRTKLAHNALREALKYNPWLSERHLLLPGEDI